MPTCISGLSDSKKRGCTYRVRGLSELTVYGSGLRLEVRQLFIGPVQVVSVFLAPNDPMKIPTLIIVSHAG